MTTPTIEPSTLETQTEDAPASAVSDLQPDSADALSATQPDVIVDDLAPQSTGYLVSTTQSTQSSRCNVGRTEQKIRLGAGAALLAAAAFAPVGRGWRIALGVLGTAEIVTGTMRYCPVSQLLGVNTCRADEQ